MVVARTRAGRSATTFGILIATLALLSGCSSQSAATSAPSAAAPSESGGASASASTVPSTSAEASPSASASGSGAAGGGQDLSIEAKDFAFSGPSSIAAGPTHIVVNNTGKEDHQAQLAKLADGTTFQDLTTALKAGDIPGALGKVQLVGGPTGITPGSTVATSANLDPGQYVFLCFVESADGIPHVAKGMISQLEVTGSASGGQVAAGDAQLGLQDFAFVGLTNLASGKHTVSVTNKGPQPHEATLVKLNPGTTVQQVTQAFASGQTPSGPPPWTGAGGVAGIAPGLTVSMDVDLQPGDYAFICFVPDATTGKPHAALGMVAGLTVQ